MKGMQVEDGLEVLALTRLLVEPALGGVGERAGVEQDVLAARPSDERRLRSELDEARDLERSADVPEAVGDVDDVGREGVTHGVEATTSCWVACSR